MARGVYALAGAGRAAISAVVHGARLGCVSAVESYGVAVLRPAAAPHLSVPCNRGTTASDARRAWPAVVHHESAAPQGRVAGVEAVPLDEALARMLICCAPAEALVSIDSALNQRRATLRQIAAALPVTSPVGARFVLSRADGRSMSPLETVARLALVADGLVVEPGVLVARVGYVDLLVEGRVVVELDGFEFHSSVRAFREDRRRDRELVAQGYLVLRFAAADVRRDVDRLVDAVRAACGQLPDRNQRLL
ncbi:endonuclease domain-containing protein [Cellulomonas sp. HZM]|uniref:endonuclease domain-containing protein n=1 Tax=Cellulomonas sp. HZM TaxID=1454010 RepID=UPI0012DD29CA|nr:DUF559 domain-containing protein [Cellulomonas sp. HZM]